MLGRRERRLTECMVLMVLFGRGGEGREEEESAVVLLYF